MRLWTVGFLGHCDPEEELIPLLMYCEACSWNGFITIEPFNAPSFEDTPLVVHCQCGCILRVNRCLLEFSGWQFVC